MNATEAADAVKPDASSITATQPEALFVLNNLGFGGSERKIIRLANRLKEEGVHVTLACLNGPYVLEQGIRRDVPCEKLERRGKFSFAALWRLRQMLLRDRPSTVIAVNLYQALYVALATMLLPYRPRKVALVNTSTFRGHRLWKRIYQSVLARFDLTVHGSEAQRRFWFRPNCAAARNSTVIYNGVDSDHFDIIGSLEAGLQFVINSVERCLRPGGIAVHTTELNMSSDDHTLDSGPTVLYRRRDLIGIVDALRDRGHDVQPFRPAPDAHVLDFHVDVPPFAHDPHLKLEVGGFVTTSAGIVVRRGSAA